MTTPEEREAARKDATRALEHASEIRDRGVSIARRWQQSKEDNNFRQMLRNIGQGIADASS